MYTSTTVFVVRIAFITSQALAPVTTRSVVDINTLAIIFAGVVVSLFSIITPHSLVPNRPINNHWKHFCGLQIFETGIGRKPKHEFGFIGNEGIATWVRFPYCGMIIIASHLHVNVFKSVDDGSFATPIARARLAYKAFGFVIAE